jgi:adenylate cyclase
VLCLFSLFLYLSDSPVVINLLQRLEAIPYDIRLKLTTPKKIDNNPPIIIIDIDEQSLKKEGRWPWSRSKLALLIEKLHEAGVVVMALDFVQAEPETNPSRYLESLANAQNKKLPGWFDEFKNTLDADRIFAHSLQGKEVILGYPFHQNLSIQRGKIHASPIVKITDNELERLTISPMHGYTANLAVITAHAAGSGFFSIDPDQDGSIRLAPLIARYKNTLYPSLALEVARLYLLEEHIKVHSAATGEIRTISHVDLGKTQIPTDASAHILIPYRGKKHHFKYIPATRVLHATQPIKELAGSIVFIGTSAVGLADLRPTPVQASFPGVEIHANILYGILHPEIISRTHDQEFAVTVVWIVLLALVMALLYPLLQPLSLVITGTVLLVATYGFNLWLWMTQNIQMPVVLSLLLVMATSSIYVVHHLLKENKERRRIHGMFGQYVPLEHINKLIENPKQISTEGEKREMTVLFSDIRNFTALSEPLSTRELKTFLNRYLTPITKIIFNNNGTIDKYVGDMVMAFWGAPLANPKHAEQAVIAAMQMQQKITELQSTFCKAGLPTISAGIGIHTGNMNVGDMGSDFRRAYTVLGDAVNLGSRLEGLTKFYGVKILLSEDTKKQCPEKIIFRYIDFVQVKGKQDAIKIYEAVALQHDLSSKAKEQLEKHQEALNLYLAKQWQAAKILFSELLQDPYQDNDVKLYRIYLERIEELSSYTSDSWNGVYTHRNK